VATPRVCLHNRSALTTSTPTAAPAPAAITDGDAPPDLIGGVYRPDTWGAGHIAINAAGHVEIVPDPDGDDRVDLKELVDQLRQRDLATPLLIRFPGILQHRLKLIAQALARAAGEFDFSGRCRCVYPVKVNQQQHVVAEVLKAGRPHGFGLEAGSKPELLAVMALVDDADTPIVCNGFKDDAFIEAVVLATKLGREIYPVIEKPSELPLIIKHAKAHGVRPRIGVRVKLASRGAGRWQASGGAGSKFGLEVPELMGLVARLRDEGMLDCLNLIHCHLGSQIQDIGPVKMGVSELTRVYAELRKAGADIQTIDLGGGLGVDYDGSRGRTESSTNYSLQEYANDIVYHVREVCEQTGVAHPDLMLEPGRAMTAHHAVLVIDVLGVSGRQRETPPRLDANAVAKLPLPIRTLYESHDDLKRSNCIEYYHDAVHAREQTLALFTTGYCTLDQRALAEGLFDAICRRILDLTRDDPIPHEEFEQLEPMLSDTYFVNSSFFQSIPDSWAIDQVFPIMPIHRLDETPTERGILADITCDSDGKVDRFAAGDHDPQPTRRTLPLHPVNGEDYLLGIFLVGAYQETLGDLHNLFGDTNAVHIRVEDGKAVVDEVVEGDTVAEVLGYVQYNPDQLRRSFRQMLEGALREGRLNLEESRTLRRFYEHGLAGYTYLT